MVPHDLPGIFLQVSHLVNLAQSNFDTLVCALLQGGYGAVHPQQNNFRVLSFNIHLPEEKGSSTCYLQEVVFDIYS